MNFEHGAILIVSAGPVGLILAWRLAPAGLPVKIFEAGIEIADQLQASTFHPPTFDYFDASEITAKLNKAGRITPTWQVRMHVLGEKAEFDLRDLAEDTAHPYHLQYRQTILSKALADELPRDALHFDALLTEVFQDDKGVSVKLNNEYIRESILIGCDGAQSLVRKAIGANFEGATYP